LEKLLSDHEARFISWRIYYAPLAVKLLKYDRCTQNTIQPWRPLLHLAPPTPRWRICVTTRHRHLHPMDAQRMGTLNVLFSQILMEISGLSVVDFSWFLGWQTSDTRLARRKLGKKIYTNHGGYRHPMAAMAPRSQR